MVKNVPANAGDAGLIPGSGRSPGEGSDKIPIDRGSWYAAAAALGVAKELWDFPGKSTGVGCHCLF